MRGAPATILAAALLAGAGCLKHTPLLELPAAPAGPTILRDVDVFAGADVPLLASRDVWIDEGRIAAIHPTGLKPAPAEATVIDGSGRTLLPGLVDAHVHVTGSDGAPWKIEVPDVRTNLEKLLYAGVTTVLDLGGDSEALTELSAELASDAIAGPDLIFAGHVICAAGGHPAASVDLALPWPADRVIMNRLTRQVRTTAELDAALDANAAAGVDWIKVVYDEIPLGVPRFDDKLLRHAVDGAHARDLRIAVHVGSERDALEAVVAGADLLTHSAYKDRYSEETLAVLAKHGTPIVVTAAVFLNADDVLRGAYRAPTYLTELQPAKTREALLAGPGDWRIEEMDGWLAALHANRENLLPNARALGRVGVPWLVGSDAPNVGWVPGIGLHQEMDALVEAGYPASRVIEAATAGNAHALGLTDRGRVEVGARADLLLVDGDPTEDIANAHRIVEVFRTGRRVHRLPPKP